MQGSTRKRRARRLVLTVVSMALATLVAMADGSRAALRQQQPRSSEAGPETAICENAHGIAQDRNRPPGTLSRPLPLVATLEDTYDAEAGNSFQGAIGFVVFDGSSSAVPKHTYGLAIDDMTVEWSEAHPIEQTAGAGCGTKTCASGPRAGKLCFNDDDCGSPNVCSGGASTGSACAALTFGTMNLFSGSGAVALNLVDFNAETTQGGFDCAPYGLTTACGQCTGAGCASCAPGSAACCPGSNDCDNDGLREVQVQLRTAGEPAPELIRLEQSASGSTSYAGLVSFSSLLNAAGDHIAFLQYDGTLTPSVTALYFDQDSGAGDANGDGTLDGPPNSGRDGCPGFCGVDDDQDALGPDRRAGAANSDDDGNGICDYTSSNPGAQCTVAANCPGGGTCLKVDEANELCGRVCAAGTASGHCSAGSGNAGAGVPGAVCTTPGTAGICNAPGTCIPDNCTMNETCTGQSTDCRGACSGNTAVRCSFPNDCLGIGKCTSPAPGTCTSVAPGTCTGIGNACMHMGLHSGGPVQCDTIHTGNIFYAYYRPTVQVGLGRPGTELVAPFIEAEESRRLCLFVRHDSKLILTAGRVNPYQRGRWAEPERQCARPVYDEIVRARIYVDSSVVGGCEDDEFSAHSIRLMECFIRGDLVLVVSTLTLQELAAAPEQVRRHLAGVPEGHIESLPLDAEARELAEAYIAEGVITATMRADAQHIAIATVARVDVLVSWNFKHIVNLHRIHGYNSVNLRRGYPTLEIRAPREVLTDE